MVRQTYVLDLFKRSSLDDLANGLQSAALDSKLILISRRMDEE